MALLSFEDLQKIWISPKFGGCGSKTTPATPISILNFSRAWQSYFLSYTLEILITYGFFIDKKMMFYSFFCVFNRTAKIWGNFFFFSRVFPQWYKKPWLWTIIYHWGNTLIKKMQFFLNFSFFCYRYKKLIEISYVGLYKIYDWPKFEGHNSLNKTATPLRSSKLK